MTVAMRIRERRKALHLNQEELADITKISQSQISRYEQGDNDPSGEALIALAKGLHTSADYLLGIVDDPTPRFEHDDLEPKEREVINSWRRGDRMEAARMILNG